MEATPEHQFPPRTPHPLLRVGLYLVAITLGPLAVAIPASILLRPLAGSLQLLPRELQPAGQVLDAFGLLLQGLAIAVMVAVTYVFRRAVDRRSFTSLGFERPPGWIAEGVTGFGLGVLLMSLILAVELALGAYRFAGFAWERQATAALVGGLLVMFAVFVIVAFYEELVARGYLLQNLSAAWGVKAGVVISSALFAAAHHLNPNASPISTLGIFVAGIQLAVGYLVSGRLWLPMGLHLSWNFFQGPVFGFPVSGIEAGGLLLLEPVGPELLTGGEFGPEASLVGLVVDLFGIWLLWIWGRRTAARQSARFGAQAPGSRTAE